MQNPQRARPFLHPSRPQRARLTTKSFYSMKAAPFSVTNARNEPSFENTVLNDANAAADGYDTRGSGRIGKR